MTYELDHTFAGHGEGVFYDIDQEVYHSIKAVSSHGVIESTKSLLHFREYVWGEAKKDSAALIFGRLMHLAILEPAKFRDITIESVFSSKALKGYKDLRTQNPGKFVLTTSESEEISNLVNAVLRHDKAPKTLQGGKAEITIFKIHPKLGIPMKARLDLLNEDYVLDYKTAQSVRPHRFERTAAEYMYHVQAAYYLYMCELVGLKKEHYLILAQEKDAPYECIVYNYGFESLDKGREIVDTMLSKIDFSYKQKVFKGYTDDIQVLSLPSWAFEYDPTKVET